MLFFPNRSSTFPEFTFTVNSNCHIHQHVIIYQIVTLSTNTKIATGNRYLNAKEADSPIPSTILTPRFNMAGVFCILNFFSFT